MAKLLELHLGLIPLDLSLCQIAIAILQLLMTLF
jgi:hypothetical protein